MNNVVEPKYDTDLVNKAYVDKRIGGVEEETIKQVDAVSKIYTTTPTTPYKVGSLYTNGTDIYVCIRARDFGAYDASDWKLASDYTNDDVANRKNTTFTSQPTVPYIVGDLWTVEENNAPGELYKCIQSRTTGSFTMSDWELATKYDNTKTTIDGGIVTSGTVQLAGSSGAIKAGITGNGTADTDIRIWAGNTYANRGSAPFRVTQGGYLYATNANIKGTITADEGKIGSWTLNAYKMYATSNTGKVAVVQVPGYEYTDGAYTSTVFAAGGTSHDNYSTCPFRVNGDGYLVATSGTIAGWELSGEAFSGSGARAVALYSDGRMSMGNDYGWINSGSSGNWFSGNSYNYPLYLIDSMSSNLPTATNCSIRLHTTYGKLYGSADTNFGSAPYLGGSNLTNSDVEFAANNGSSRYYSKVNTWIYGGQYAIIDGGANSDTGQVILKSSGWGINIGASHSELGISAASNVYIGDSGTTVKIKGSTYGGSGKDMKTDIKVLDDETKENLLDAYRERELYRYKFKKEYDNDSREHIGFVLDELEDSMIGPLLGVHKSIVDTNIKTYDPQSLGQLNFAVISILLNKIDKLEERIKLLEGGN